METGTSIINTVQFTWRRNCAVDWLVNRFSKHRKNI